MTLSDKIKKFERVLLNLDEKQRIYLRSKVKMAIDEAVDDARNKSNNTSFERAERTC